MDKKKITYRNVKRNIAHQCSPQYTSVYSRCKAFQAIVRFLFENESSRGNPQIRRSYNILYQMFTYLSSASRE